MENDILKNKIAPWQEKGRWYHFNATCDGVTGWTLNRNKSDDVFADSIIAGERYVTMSGYHIIDVKLLYHELTPLTDGDLVNYPRISTTREQVIILIAPSQYKGDVDAWVFAVK